MPKRSSKKKRLDVTELAKLVVDEATSEKDDPEPTLTPDGKNAAAVALGRRGGKKGGPARADKLTADQRSEIARKAANTRWQSR